RLGLGFGAVAKWYGGRLHICYSPVRFRPAPLDQPNASALRMRSAEAFLRSRPSMGLGRCRESLGRLRFYVVPLRLLRTPTDRRSTTRAAACHRSLGRETTRLPRSLVAPAAAPAACPPT